jgi:hypothetical protein
LVVGWKIRKKAGIYYAREPYKIPKKIADFFEDSAIVRRVCAALSVGLLKLG